MKNIHLPNCIYRDGVIVPCCHDHAKNFVAVWIGIRKAVVDFEKHKGKP